MRDRMTNEQAVLLARAIKAGWPHQKFDDFTVDLWCQAIRNAEPVLSYADCMAAIQVLVMQSAFGGPDAIRSTVQGIRSKRLEDAGVDTITLNVDPDDPVAYTAELRALNQSVADGTLHGADLERYRAGLFTVTGKQPCASVEAIGSPRPRAVETLVKGVFRRPPRALPADYGDRPRVKAINPPRDVSQSEASRAEEERDRQLAAMEAMIDAQGGTEATA